MSTIIDVLGRLVAQATYHDQATQRADQAAILAFATELAMAGIDLPDPEVEPHPGPHLSAPNPQPQVEVEDAPAPIHDPLAAGEVAPDAPAPVDEAAAGFTPPAEPLPAVPVAQAGDDSAPAPVNQAAAEPAASPPQTLTEPAPPTEETPPGPVALSDVAPVFVAPPDPMPGPQS